MKKTVSVLIVFLVLISKISVFAVPDIYTSAEHTAEYLMNTIDSTGQAFPGSEWSVFGLARYHTSLPERYFEQYYGDVKDYIDANNGELNFRKNTDYSKLILVLTALGIDAQKVSNCNLFQKLGDFEKTVSQGQNGAIWALIALDCGNYVIPQNEGVSVQASREMYIEYILTSQKTDGGWSLGDSDTSDVDITAMALCALSGYQDISRVKSAVDSAVGFLSRKQNEKGGFSNQDGENSESVAQVIIAMCQLCVPVTDNRFMKNGNTVYDNLMTFYDGKGGFYHTYDDKVINQISTEQAFSALVALKRAKDNQTPLYDMKDIEKKNIDTIRVNQSEFPNRHADIVKKEIIENKTFLDISVHDAQKQIEALASRKIINGKNNNFFEPDSIITRAEFASIITKGLGLSSEGKEVFSDVNKDDWFFDVISAAYQYGIIKGISESEFNPNGNITKEESAVIMSRVAKLCGITADYDSFTILDILAGFCDYVNISNWAKNEVAFCYDVGIFSVEETAVEPQTTVTRAEVAVMFYNVLRLGNLL